MSRSRCRANMAHKRQPRPGSDLGFQTKVLERVSSCALSSGDPSFKLFHHRSEEERGEPPSENEPYGPARHFDLSHSGFKVVRSTPPQIRQVIVYSYLCKA